VIELLVTLARLLRWRSCVMRGIDPCPWAGPRPRLTQDWTDDGTGIVWRLS